MKHLATILLVVLPFWLSAQNDTVIYYGVNGKMTDTSHPVLRKIIKYKNKKRIKIITGKHLENDEWAINYTEKIFRKKADLYDIRVKGKDFSEQITREFVLQPDGTFHFTDLQDDKLKRTGTSLSKIPLTFHGELTEYYSNGNIKSVSVYENNELISNRNLKPDGEKYIDNIFYSVEREPRFLPGMQELHSHVLKTFRDSGIDLSQLEGRIVVGFVVMETGKIEGVRIEKGIGNELNNLALQAFFTLQGDWQPASINGENVRFYQLFPINFIYRKHDFDYLEMRGSMLYWQVN